MSDQPEPQQPPTDRRARPRLSEQIQVIRELWLLREQARVQAAERCFLTELERILSGRVPHSNFSLPDDPPPAPPPHHLTSNTLRSPIPEPPPLPSHISSVSSYTTATFLEDGHVYESNPPPRDAQSAPARERPGLISEEVEQLRSRQRVTNLSPEFRALLEGNSPPPTHTLARSRSFGQLTDQRAVSNALESEFRHHLEGMLVRRGTSPPSSQIRHLYRSGEYSDSHRQQPPPPFEDTMPIERPSPALEPVVQALREEVNILKNVISASFDLQLDIQRSIRQEVSAAMNSPVKLSMRPQHVQDTSVCTSEPSSSSGTPMETSAPAAEKSSKPVAAGTCTVCLEAHIDSLLYGCGHMCTCARCGRQLIAIGQPCPICRAPVRDVVRAFMVTE